MLGREWPNCLFWEEKVNTSSVINNHLGFDDKFAFYLPTLLYNLGNSVLLLGFLTLLVTHNFDLFLLESCSLFDLGLLYPELLEGAEKEPHCIVKSFSQISRVLVVLK